MIILITIVICSRRLDLGVARNLGQSATQGSACYATGLARIALRSSLAYCPTMHTLLIDSNPLRQRQVRAILVVLGQKAGQVELAQDLKTTRELLSKRSYELIFVAIDSPSLGGLRILPDIRELGQESARIVAYKAGATKEDVLAAASSGAFFLVYPFTVDGVEQAIGRPKAAS